jgi:hypothetical protein
MTALRLGVCKVISIAVVAAGPSLLSAQSAQSLALLTVPPEQLPGGCQLEAVDPDATGPARFVMYPGLRENPWIGTHRPTVAAIRQVVDGPAGPRYGLSGPALRDRLADDVAEAYRARYTSAEHRIEVYAVRFTDPEMTLPSSLNRLASVPAQPPRIVFGTTAALVLSSRFRTSRNSVAGVTGPDCVRAVMEHLTGLK